MYTSIDFSSQIIACRGSLVPQIKDSYTRGVWLSGDLKIEPRDKVQRLDYVGVPFRCSGCKNTGHLRGNRGSTKNLCH
jgi:hypothetical protein